MYNRTTAVPQRTEMIRPGLFGGAVAADGRRLEFDYQNEQILATGNFPDVVFFGDSITQMWELGAYFSFRFVNRGIGGDITSTMMRRFEADVLQLKPKAVVILAGINDLGAVVNEYIWGTAGRPEAELVTATAKNLLQMARLANKKNIQPVLCSLLPTDLHYLPTEQAAQRMTVEINTLLQKNADVSTYVDYHAAFVAQDGLTLKEGLSYDGLHPHHEGYRVMAAQLLPVLREILKR